MKILLAQEWRRPGYSESWIMAGQGDDTEIALLATRYSTDRGYVRTIIVDTEA